MFLAATCVRVFSFGGGSSVCVCPSFVHSFVPLFSFFFFFWPAVPVV